MVVQTYNLSIREVEMGDCEFKANLGHIASSCLKKKNYRN
jgi:hypothetical protein